MAFFIKKNKTVPCHSTEILQFQETSKFHCSQDKMDISAPHKDQVPLEFPANPNFSLLSNTSFETPSS